MRLNAVQYAVHRFNTLREEFNELIGKLGLDALVCLVRQKGDGEDSGWAFFEISLGEKPYEDVLTGKLVETRSGQRKQVEIVLDTDGIDSIEFEIFDNYPEGNSPVDD